MKKMFNKLIKNRRRKPKQVVIETTNTCNLNCPFCLVGMQNELINAHGSVSHNLMTRDFGMMSVETFSKVRNELKNFGIKKAFLHFQGEPFLNKNTPDFAKQLKDDGLWVGIFTNGQAFKNNTIENTVSSEIDLIRFSIDGASEETYQKNRVGGRFSNAYNNMRKVVKAHQGKKTRIEWQFLPLKNNEHEVAKAQELANEIGVHFFTKSFRVTDPEIAPINEKYQVIYLKKPCTDIYLQLGIYWNGDVVPCCYDVDGKEIMGNINSQSLLAIWNSEKYKLFRKKVDTFDKYPDYEPEICSSCLRWQ
ncbi:radical SAM protein [Candidatus Parcubacteria bacterium]|nr:MAG: radical SAM protein [Candidatus Parcubacteria bacterium]